MNIIVNDTNFINQERIFPNEIKCPKCDERIRINFKDYKINLFECKNNHKFNNILLEDFKFNNKQNSEIICNKSNLSKKSISVAKFYICYSCGMNICQFYKLNHYEDHNIIEYDKKDYCHNCKKYMCIF